MRSVRNIHVRGEPVTLTTPAHFTRHHQAFRGSEHEYRAILERLGEGFVLADEQGEILEWNKAMERISGLRSEESVGAPLWDVLYRFVPMERKGPERSVYLRSIVLEALHTGRVHTENEVTEAEIERPDGTRKFIRQTLFVIQSEHGNRLGSIIQDITERKQTEKESGERFRFLVQQSWDVISVHDRNLRVQYVTPSVERILGYSVEEFQAASVMELVHPDDLTVVREELGKVFKKENAGTPTLFRVRRADGSWIYVETVANNLLDAHPVNGIVLTYRDVTARVHSEQLLRESEELHRGLITAVPDMILRTDLEGNILFVNETNFPNLGYIPKERILGKNLLSFIVPGERRKAADNFRSMAELPLGLREYRVRFEDGSELDCEVNGDVLRDEAGAPFGMVYVVRDISQRKKVEAERKNLEAQLIYAQKIESVGTLAAGIAHDFNNILNIVKGNISLIVHRPESAEKLAKRIDAIERATNRGAQVVKQLLMYARKTKTEQQSVVINDLIREVVVLLEATFPETIEVHLQLAANVPTVGCDLNQIHQVLLNLSVNARDAMPDGGQLTIATESIAGENVRARFTKASARQYVRISIDDTGTGMDEETRKRIFDPFFTTKEAGKGTGLGLAVVHDIIENHKGFIEVESRWGEGTRFAIYLPGVQQAPESTEDPKSDYESVAGGTETILIVEDESFARDLVSEALMSEGYQVLAAADGEEGMVLYRRYASRIAMVITDVGLPKMNGEELCRHVKEAQPGLPMIVVSGFLDPEKEASLRAIGVEEVIAKPYKLQGLLLHIRTILDKKKSGATRSEA